MAHDFFSGYIASFGHSAGSTLHMVQNRGAELSPQKALTEVIAAGDVDRKAVMLSHADPVARLMSADLASFISIVSPSVGLAIDASSTFRMQKRANAGTFDAGANHVLTSLTAGFLCIDSIQARQDDNDQAAFAELLCYPHSSDGITAPWTFSAGQTLGATPPAFGSQFYLGPAYLGAAELEGLVGSEVRFGLEYQLLRAAGNPYATLGSIIRRRPIFRFTFAKVSVAATTNLFLAALGDPIAAYFWKGVPGGTRIAKTGVSNDVHVKAAATAGAWGVDQLGFDRDENGNLVVEVRPTVAVTLVKNSHIP